MFQIEIVERSDIRSLMVNFMPSWWAVHYGIHWGERMFYDEEYRMDMDQEMRRLLAERFPDLPVGSRDPHRRPVQPALNNAITPAYFGCEFVLPEDGYARWHPAASYGAVFAVAEDDPWARFPFTEIARQTRRMNASLGTDEIPFLPPIGVLNNGIQLLGDRLLGDMLDEPDLAQRLLRKVARHEVMKLEIDAANGWRGLWYLFNCSVEMIGPGIYAESVLEHDAEVTGRARSLGCGVHLHHCGCFDGFATAYRGLGPIQSLEVGFTSDPRIAASFPNGNGHLYLILDQNIVRTGTEDQVRDAARRLVEGVGDARSRVSLLALDLDVGTPDENVAALFDRFDVLDR